MQRQKGPTVMVHRNLGLQAAPLRRLLAPSALRKTTNAAKEMMSKIGKAMASTILSRTGPKGLLAAALLAILVSLVSPATARNAEEDVPGWQHHLVGRDDGAPPFIRAIAQTPDGFIWLGAVDGLHRYDGIRFERLAPSSAKPLQSDAVNALAAMPNGDLWVGHDWGGLSLVRNGRHRVVDATSLSTVSLIRSTSDSGAWAVSLRSQRSVAWRLLDGRWIPWANFPVSGYVSDSVVGDGRGLWMLVGGRLLSASPERHTILQASRNAFVDASLAVDAAGHAWLILKDRIHRLAPDDAKPLGPAVRRPPATRGGAAAFDGSSAFWVAEGGSLLRRYSFDAVSGIAKRVGEWRSDFWWPDAGFDAHDLPMLVDREGTLLIGTSRGLEMFRRSSFAKVLGAADTGLGTGAVPYAVRDGAGDVWIKRGSQLFKVAEDGSLRRERIVLPPEFTPCASTTGGLWVPDGRGRLIVFGGKAKRPISYLDSDLLGSTQYGHCVEEADGALWANEAEGLARLGSSRGKADLGEDNGSAVVNMIGDGDDGILAYVGRGSLWRNTNDRFTAVLKSASMPLGTIEVMFRSPRYLLLGGDRGLVRYVGGRFETLSNGRRPELAQITGIVQTSDGNTWLQSASGVIRMRTRDLDRAFSEKDFEPPMRVYSEADGLPGSQPYLNMSSVTADRHDRVWVTTNNGVARFDPGAASSKATQPHVVVTGMEADGRQYDPQDRNILPAGTSRLQVGFTAPSTVDPQGPRFRYRLAGMDRDWVVAERGRSAVYTSLAPGTYRLDVQVTDSEGRWAPKGASVEFEISPRLYQMRWFQASCALLALLAAWFCYRWRVGLVSRRLRNSAAERTHERERIAREIHDTFLQSVQGLVLQFQSAASRLATRDPTRILLERSLDRADELIAQGRERVLGLRSEDQPMDLTAMLEQALDEAPFQFSVNRSFQLRGARRTVAPAVALEAREIVGEALFNAARHSHAENVDLELVFGVRRLEIVVSDDGIGMSEQQAAGLKRKGFGLAGMHERAAQIGAMLTVGPGSPRGTSVRLRVPARHAYSPHRRGIGLSRRALS
jgi:signal transduction histidine kinase/ligand-binding sensor domain-containing protein